MFRERVDRRVIEVEESESGVSFLKFFLDRFFYTKDHFFYGKIFRIRVDRRVIGVEESESGVSFLKFFSLVEERLRLKNCLLAFLSVRRIKKTFPTQNIEISISVLIDGSIESKSRLFFPGCRKKCFRSE